MKAYEPIFAFLLAIVLLLIIDLSKNIKFQTKFIIFIRLIAGYSYTLYLIHYSIFNIIVLCFSQKINSYLLFIIGFIISNIVSSFIGHYSEKIWTRKLKKWLYYKNNIL